MARPEDNRIVTLSEGAEIIGRKRSTVANWASLGYMKPVGHLPKITPKGRPAGLYRLKDIKAVSAKMPGVTILHRIPPPPGYVTPLEAGQIMNLSGQRVLTLARDGKIPCVRIPWGLHGDRSFTFILKSAAQAPALDRQVKPIRFVRGAIRTPQGPRDEPVYDRKEPETIERPLIYFRDAICLAARQELFQSRGGKLARHYTQAQRKA